ncbi:hypothetical protein H0H87_004619 [Tephrocybe sp. NHM501043]|nr:hypothetical protein H0H87_004619 [Tephrocybe sp. NHM501043]
MTHLRIGHAAGSFPFTYSPQFDTSEHIHIGDKWAYSFNVPHDIPTLIAKRGGNASFVQSLDDHFEGGHNDHTNEPSHHIPYLYALAGAAYKTQLRVREIARRDYNNTPNGLAGNEDCGQMSAWYIFSAMGFYPVNPVSGEYVVGSPFFDKITISLPAPPHADDKKERRLTIVARGAPAKPYVKSLTVNGRVVSGRHPIIRHEEIRDGGEVVFEMSDTMQRWGNSVVFGDDVDADHQQMVVDGANHVEL